MGEIRPSGSDPDESRPDQRFRSCRVKHSGPVSNRMFDTDKSEALLAGAKRASDLHLYGGGGRICAVAATLELPS